MLQQKFIQNEKTIVTPTQFPDHPETIINPLKSVLKKSKLDPNRAKPICLTFRSKQIQEQPINGFTLEKNLRMK